VRVESGFGSGEAPEGEACGALASPELRAPAGPLATRGWRASLSLGFEPRHGRTVLAHQAHFGPLRVQRPFYPEPNGTCHVYVLHPPGGVVGGDELEVSVRGVADGRALLTTPGATKLYRSLGAEAVIRQSFELEGDFCLEWLPQETIAFAGAEARVATCVALSRGASYAGWEVVCLGRPAAGERFERGSLRLEHRIEREGKLQWIERAEYLGGDRVLDAPWGLAGHSVVGTFVIAPGVPPDESWVEAVRALSRSEAEPDVNPPSATNFAVTLVSSVVVLRYLGDHAREAASLFRRAWQVLRPRYASHAVPPRIWNT
jgi:urease accessory protein